MLLLSHIEEQLVCSTSLFLRMVVTVCCLDVNRKDYRAWYGLGQAYELLNMHQYSLHYYQRATALRYATLTQRIVFSTQALHSPYDVRIWQAQGMCYEEMGR